MQLYLDELQEAIRIFGDTYKQYAGITRVETLSSEISELYEQIAKKMMNIGNCMTTLSEYWLAVEKRMPEAETTSFPRKISSDYLYLKTSCLTYSASMTKPIELMKLGISQMFRSTRKKLEPFGQMLALRAHLNKSYLEEFKKTASFTFPGLNKGTELMTEEDSLKIKRLMQNHVV